MVVNLTIALPVFLMNMSTLISVDVTLLPKYMNSSTNFQGLLFNEEMIPSWLKHIYYVLNQWFSNFFCHYPLHRWTKMPAPPSSNECQNDGNVKCQKNWQQVGSKHGEIRQMKHTRVMLKGWLKQEGKNACWWEEKCLAEWLKFPLKRISLVALVMPRVWD